MQLEEVSGKNQFADMLKEENFKNNEREKARKKITKKHAELKEEMAALEVQLAEIQKENEKGVKKRKYLEILQSIENEPTTLDQEKENKESLQEKKQKRNEEGLKKLESLRNRSKITASGIHSTKCL